MPGGQDPFSPLVDLRMNIVSYQWYVRYKWWFEEFPLEWLGKEVTAYDPGDGFHEPQQAGPGSPTSHDFYHIIYNDWDAGFIEWWLSTQGLIDIPYYDPPYQTRKTLISTWNYKIFSGLSISADPDGPHTAEDWFLEMLCYGGYYLEEELTFWESAAVEVTAEDTWWLEHAPGERETHKPIIILDGPRIIDESSFPTT